MDQQNLSYIGTDRYFFDVPSVSSSGRSYTLPNQLDWSGWRRSSSPSWASAHPGHDLPVQGWKIHVSSTVENAQRLLNTVAQYAWNHRISFKWIPTEPALLARNSKQADRGSSGKFITLYPRDENELREVLRTLDGLIGGERGPYILSDLRWNAGPLYVRYGAFLPMQTVDDDGDRVPAVLAPTGEYVPDLREARFAPPPWVELPDFLAEQLAALGSEDAPVAFPYDIERPMHYSNGGGVYLAKRHSDGTQVVLKEGRRGAGLTPDGRDAVDRLYIEERALRTLAGDSAVPDVLDSFDMDDHRFLVLEYIDGASLNKQVVSRSPIVRALSKHEDYLDYREWGLDMAAKLDEALARVHAAGITVGDVHPRNVLLTDAGRVVLIDFEMSQPLEDAGANLLGAPGFSAPPGLSGVAADRYSMACVKLFLFLPLTPLIPLDTVKAAELTDAAAVTYALPRDFVTRVQSELGVGPEQRPLSRLAHRASRMIADWPTQSEDEIIGLQVVIARAIQSGSDFSRSDRSFPGDPRQFAEGGFGLAHGAAGVILALELANLEVDDQANEWLDDAVAGDSASEHLGLYDGLAGVGWMRRMTGDGRQAQALLERILKLLPARLASNSRTPIASGIYSGLAGLGLYLLDEASTSAAEGAEQIGEELLRRQLTSQERVGGQAQPTRQGLMWGPSGVALFATRLYERTGDERMLRLARAELQKDLDRLAETPDGTLQMDEDWRLMPYLATGSAGVGLALAQFLPHADDPERLTATLGKIQLAAQAPFTIESGLFSGRAGLIHFLVSLSRLGLATKDSEAAAAAHIDALRLHALRYRTGIAFPGAALLRLSFDLGTGSAGVLTALESYSLLAFDRHRDGWQALLPLLSPQIVVHPRVSTHQPLERG